MPLKWLSGTALLGSGRRSVTGVRGPAVSCLTRDTEALLRFFDVPAAHRDPLRRSNTVERVFATVRHRTVRHRAAFRHRTLRPKRALSQKTVTLTVFTLVRAAAKKWRRLKGANQVPRVIDGVKFTNGLADCDPAKTTAA